MTNNTPIFAINEPQHFSDYGFDPQIDYFQVLEEARKHKRDSSSSSRSAIDNLHFKLQKPISKDYDNSKKIKKTRKRWWKNALHFFKRKRHTNSDNNHHPPSSTALHRLFGGAGGRTPSGPVYLTESRSGSSTPYHRSSTSRPSSGPLGGVDIPYISLTELNMEEMQSHKISASPMPIYLVT